VEIVVVVGLQGETAGEVGVEDDAMIETEILVEEVTGNSVEAMDESSNGAAQDIRDLPHVVDLILGTEGHFDEMLTPMYPVDEEDRDVMKEGGYQHLNHPLHQQTLGLPHGLLLVRPCGIAAVHCQGLRLLLRADVGPFLGHQTGAAIEVGEAEEEGGARIVELAGDLQLLPIPLARVPHHPSADEQRLIPLVYLLHQEDLVTTAPNLSASLHQEDPAVTLPPGRDRLLLRDLDLLAVLPFAKFLAVGRELRCRLLQSMILKLALLLVRTD
jgi:hypothetical protein